MVVQVSMCGHAFTSVYLSLHFLVCLGRDLFDFCQERFLVGARDVSQHSIQDLNVKIGSVPCTTRHQFWCLQQLISWQDLVFFWNFGLILSLCTEL
jgi:hypothetical protein